MLAGVEIAEVSQASVKLAAVAVEGHYVGNLSTELVGNRHFAAARLVEDRHLCAVSEGASFFAHDDVNIVDEAAVPDLIIGDIFSNVVDNAVVADGDIVESGIADAAVHRASSLQDELSRQMSDSDCPGEGGSGNMVDIGVCLISDKDLAPIFGAASVCGQAGDFVLTRVSVGVHC